MFAKTSITKYLKSGGLNIRGLLSHISGGQKSKMKVLAESVHFENCEKKSVPRFLSYFFQWLAGNPWCSRFVEASLES